MTSPTITTARCDVCGCRFPVSQADCEAYCEQGGEPAPTNPTEYKEVANVISWCKPCAGIEEAQ